MSFGWNYFTPGPLFLSKFSVFWDGDFVIFWMKLFHARAFWVENFHFWDGGFIWIWYPWVLLGVLVSCQDLFSWSSPFFFWISSLPLLRWRFYKQMIFPDNLFSPFDVIISLHIFVFVIISYMLPFVVSKLHLESLLEVFPYLLTNWTTLEKLGKLSFRLCIRFSHFKPFEIPFQAIWNCYA